MKGSAECRELPTCLPGSVPEFRHQQLQLWNPRLLIQVIDCLPVNVGGRLVSQSLWLEISNDTGLQMKHMD